MSETEEEVQPWHRGWAGDPWLHEYYEQYRPRVFGDPAEPIKIVVLLGSADISGGSYVIFQHALHWQRRGADVTIATLMPRAALFSDWHPALRELTITTIDDLKDEVYDLAVATWWRTVYELPNVRARHALYFIQSIESRFYAVGSDSYAAPLAELSYRYDIPMVAIARWIQAYLAFEHERPSFLVRNGIDKDRYQPFGEVVEPRRPGVLRVLVEGPADVAMKNVPAAVDLARKGGADEVWLMTSSDIQEFDGVDRVLSRVPIDLTGVVYRSCDVLLKLSRVEGMYGPPLEMFHCGGTVVTFDVTGHEEYVLDGVNGLVVPMGDDDGVVEAVRRLKDDPELLQRLQHEALITADRWPDWDEVAEEFWAVIRLLVRRPAPDKLITMLAIRGAGITGAR